MNLGEQEARGLIEEVSEIQSSTRARLHANGWQWLVVWCLAFFGAALTGLIPALTPYADTYWIYATPIGLALTFVVAHRVDSRSPVRRNALTYWMIGLAMTVASTLVAVFLPEDAVVVVVWVVLGFGFAAFAWVERFVPAAWLLASMAVLSGVLGLLVEDTFALYPTLGLAFSAALAGVIAGMMTQGRK